VVVHAISNWDLVQHRLTGRCRIAARRGRALTLAPGKLGHQVRVRESRADKGSWVVVAVDVGPASRFAPDKVLASAASLLSSTVIAVRSKLMVRRSLRYGRFDAFDLERAIVEVAQDATKLRRRLLQASGGAPTFNVYSE
jgi:hypothetical protein